jgi:hypothetical protein
VDPALHRARTYSAEYNIAGRMAVSIIDTLEVIQIISMTGLPLL